MVMHQTLNLGNRVRYPAGAPNIMGKYYGQNRGQYNCPCCSDGQTPMSAKKTARRKAKEEIRKELKENAPVSKQ